MQDVVTLNRARSKTDVPSSRNRLAAVA